MANEMMNISKFQNVLRMLLSKDTEDQITALCIFEELSFKEHMCFILLAMKHSNSNLDMVLWKEHCPKILENINALEGMVLDKPLTYKNILKIITIHKVDNSQMQFFLDEFSSHMLNQMRALGYNFIEEIELTIKVKEDEFNESHRKLSQSN